MAFVPLGVRVVSQACTKYYEEEVDQKGRTPRFQCEVFSAEPERRLTEERGDPEDEDPGNKHAANENKTPTKTRREPAVTHPGHPNRLSPQGAPLKARTSL